jgi:hypothetical protein
MTVTTLAGLLHHLAKAERQWFHQVLLGAPARPGDPDASWQVDETQTVAGSTST